MAAIKVSKNIYEYAKEKIFINVLALCLKSGGRAKAFWISPAFRGFVLAEFCSCKVLSQPGGW